MDTNKISGEGAEDIEVPVEDPNPYSEFFTPRHEPFDDDPVEVARHSALLELLTKGPREGTSKVNIVSPRETPKEWLQRLTTVDFADPSTINNLRSDLVINNVADFDLVTNGESDFTVSPFPGALTVDDIPPKEEEAIFSSYLASDHPGLLCLEGGSQTDILADYRVNETPKQSAAGFPLPSVVLPIGRLQNWCKDKAGISYSGDTDYVLVIDAVADAHPLWLVFDRKVRSIGEGQTYVKPETVQLVLSGIE
ncbi:uncharacterized protein FSUBG_8357 [Fusarium subglutinans]|uniref:Uncharacterized protein n=1 Tax=Gibberella subglutinans TaxID=42677 RepID=A0A8H5USP9_GIBSU|nr:uncharacterized protein FSUBG_8357 [Fusarium subglutinans]KAF5597707.1 hypothetical protein FSUBG_8357 [Fusarium subglutinans]